MFIQLEQLNIAIRYYNERKIHREDVLIIYRQLRSELENLEDEAYELENDDDMIYTSRLITLFETFRKWNELVRGRQHSLCRRIH